MTASDLLVHFMSLYVDSGERTGGTKVFASAASYAAGLIDGRNHGREFIVLIEHHHRDCSYRAVTFAVAAFHTIHYGDAVLLHPYCMAYLCARLHIKRDWTDSTRRTHAGTLVTLRPAIAALVRHGGLHQRQQTRRGPEHLIRASRHTQLACRTMLCHIGSGNRTRRSDGSVAVNNGLVLYLGQSTIHLLLLLGEYGSSSGHGRSHQERASTLVN